MSKSAMAIVIYFIVSISGCGMIRHRKPEVIDVEECSCDYPWSTFLDPCCIGAVQPVDKNASESAAGCGREGAEVNAHESESTLKATDTDSVEVDDVERKTVSH